MGNTPWGELVLKGRKPYLGRDEEVAAGRKTTLLPLARHRVVNRKPRYHRLKQMEGPDERLCNGTVRLSVIGCRSTALCRSNRDCGGEMLSKEYLDTARTILRVARTMTDQHVVGQLEALAEDYERRAEKAANADAAEALARSAARESAVLS
jgi:hypothetical protein